MPCTSPLQGFRSRTKNPNGKRNIVFNPNPALVFTRAETSIDCGQCLECRIRKANDMAVRCSLEASLYEDENCFVTLTYADEFLPENNSIDPRDPEEFVQKIRNFILDYYEEAGLTYDPLEDGIRTFGCAEYGDDFGRPHYHLLLFNFTFPDLVYEGKSESGEPEFSSEMLDKFWGKGRARVGKFSHKAAAYVARYCIKKINGKNADEHYKWLNEYGEYVNRLPERSVCVSKNPAIGRRWFEKNVSDVYFTGPFEFDGKVMPVPKYFDRRMELDNPEKMREIKKARSRSQKICGCLHGEVCIHSDPEKSTPRLFTKKRVKEIKTEKLRRNIK